MPAWLTTVPPRLFTDGPLNPSAGPVTLSPSAARHAQVLRLQAGDAVTLFDGSGGQWLAAIASMGRREVTAVLASFDPTERELGVRVTIAAGMPANDRFDWLVEKATELGVAAIQPLVCERSVLRVAGERALRKQQHWTGVAIAAAEQCGRTRVPDVLPPRELRDWLSGLSGTDLRQDDISTASRWLLSPNAPQAWRAVAASGLREATLLSGPEGGLTADEERQARAAAFTAVTLGARTLRAETAPLVALAQLPV